MRKITLIVVHCTATRCTSSLTPRQLEESHRLRGFACCGYHYYIQRNGQTTPMRPVEKIGAHAKGYNANSIGIAYEGGLNADGNPADTRTDAQRAALVSLLTQLHEHYPDARIVGHRDLSPDLNGNGRIEPSEYVKACPCFNAAQEYTYITAHKPDKPQPTRPNGGDGGAVIQTSFRNHRTLHKGRFAARTRHARPYDTQTHPTLVGIAPPGQGRP